MKFLIHRVAEYVTNLFKGTCVKVEVVKGHETLRKEYPCLAAVDRAANQPSTSRYLFEFLKKFFSDGVAIVYAKGHDHLKQ